jgi:hypothetical protein
MRLNKFLPVALIYFFINTVGLPFGLSWVAILAPLLYVWILVTRKKEVVWPFLVILTPFILVHTLVTGVDMNSYIISLVNVILLYVFCQAFYTFLKVCRDPELIFRYILIINFVFCLVGIVFYFTPWDDIFWISQYLTSGVKDYRRFKLFTYEASIYATSFMPVFFFYVLQYFFRQNRIRGFLLLPMLILPLVLSFSIGVITGALLAIIITILLNPRLLAKRRVTNFAINTGFLSGSTLFVLFVFFRNNTLFTRITNIFIGADSSAQGRIVDSYVLANKMLEQKSEWWGIGMGQVKILGYDIVKVYYRYIEDFTATIPNVTAETLAIFGWWGIIIKFSLEIFLFFYTRVWTNYYRLMLFVFIFIYQFTGSFFTNLAEYIIWILAFTNVFSQFDARKREVVSIAPVPGRA